MTAPITNFTASISAQISVSQAYTTDTVAGNQGLNQPISLGKTLPVANQATAPPGGVVGNQCFLFSTTVAGGGTATLDLSAARANIIANSTATMAKIKGLVLWLPLPGEQPSG